MAELAKAEGGLYFPLGGQWTQQAVKAKGTYRRVKRLMAASQADGDRHIVRACIVMPDAGAVWMTNDPRELQGLIDKLQEMQRQLQSRGQSRVVSLVESKV